MPEMPTFKPPYDCGICTEDLECLGCGAKLGFLAPGQCPGIEQRQEHWQREQAKERKLLAELRKKFEEVPDFYTI